MRKIEIVIGTGFDKTGAAISSGEAAGMAERARAYLLERFTGYQEYHLSGAWVDHGKNITERCIKFVVFSGIHNPELTAVILRDIFFQKCVTLEVTEPMIEFV